MSLDNGITIRRAVIGDAEWMAKIETECFADPWSRESIETSLSSEQVICLSALFDGQPVGYGMIAVAADECEILNLAVKAELRRRGIASALMNEMLSEASRRGALFAYLEVRASNTGASALYGRHGFSPIGKRKNYYRYPTEDAIVMAKDLSVTGA